MAAKLSPDDKGGHTLLPWTWVRGGEYLIPEAHKDRRLGFSIHEKENREQFATVIAYPGTWGGASRSERTANAEFIAHACNNHYELLKALTEARDAIASLDEFALGGVDVPDIYSGEIIGQYGIRDELLSKINAAILKATGGQP